jgi:hypothetical protein
MRCWWFVGNLNNIYMPTSVNSLDFLQDHCMIGAVCFYVHKLCILIACVFYFSATIRILLSGDCWWAERSAKLRPLRWVTWRCLRRHHCRSMYCVFRLGIHMHGKTFAGKSHFMFFVSPVGRTKRRFTTDYSNAGLVHTTFCWVCSFLQMGPLREDHYFARGGLPLFFLLLCQWAGENIS